MLLVKIEEATEEIVNLKERIRRLDAEKLDTEYQMNIRLELVSLFLFFCFVSLPLSSPSLLLANFTFFRQIA